MLCAYSAVEIASLVERFSAGQLPKGEWTHAAHFAVCVSALAAAGGDIAAACARLRVEIPVHNEASGVANTDTSGYHETVTRAYVEAVAAFMAAAPDGADLATMVNTLIAGPIFDRNFLLAFYSRSHLLSVRARREWVEPDLLGMDALRRRSAASWALRGSGDLR